MEDKFIDDEDINEYIKEFDKDNDSNFILTRFFKQRRVHEFFFMMIYKIYDNKKNWNILKIQIKKNVLYFKNNFLFFFYL